MVYVNDAICNGCGECIEVCPTGALILQTNHAFIDQDLCLECYACVESCPQGAIILSAEMPINQDVIKIPEAVPDYSVSQIQHSEQISVRDMILPTISSMLLWTGRELVPRLADMALGYLDRRIQSSQSAPMQKLDMRRRSQVSMSEREGRRKRLRQRRRRNSR